MKRQKIDTEKRGLLRSDIFYIILAENERQKNYTKNFTNLILN